jgi:hypothetical protein
MVPRIRTRRQDSCQASAELYAAGGGGGSLGGLGGGGFGGLGGGMGPLQFNSLDHLIGAGEHGRWDFETSVFAVLRRRGNAAEIEKWAKVVKFANIKPE